MAQSKIEGQRARLFYAHQLHQKLGEFAANTEENHMRQLTRIEIMRLAAHTGADVRTVKTYLRNGSVRPVTAEAIVRALRELKIPDPRTAPQP